MFIEKSDAVLTGTVLRAVVDNLGRECGILTILVGAVTDTIDEVGLGAETDRINAATKVIRLIQHIGDADLLQNLSAKVETINSIPPSQEIGRPGTIGRET